MPDDERTDLEDAPTPESTDSEADEPSEDDFELHGKGGYSGGPVSPGGH